MNLNPASITELRFLLDEDKEKGLKNIPKKILTKEGKITKKAIEYNKKLVDYYLLLLLKNYFLELGVLLL